MTNVSHVALWGFAGGDSGHVVAQYWLNNLVTSQLPSSALSWAAFVYNAALVLPKLLTHTETVHFVSREVAYLVYLTTVYY